MGSMTESTMSKSEIFGKLPPPWPEPLEDAIRARLGRRSDRLVVLDDDPTGTQTVHEVPVLAEWTEDALEDELARSPVFYVLTNSRSLPPEQAARLDREIGSNLKAAAGRTGHAFAVDTLAQLESESLRLRAERARPALEAYRRAVSCRLNQQSFVELCRRGV